MSTATTTTSHDTGQQTSPRGLHREAQQPVTSQKHSAARRLRATMAAVRSEASGYWRTVTPPLPEAGIRLLPQSSLSTFASTIQTYRERLQEAARELGSQYDRIESEAQRRLGTLFNASDYPQTLDGLFDLEVSYPTIEPPIYLMALQPAVYQQAQARGRERFESAVEVVEHAAVATIRARLRRSLRRQGHLATDRDNHEHHGERPPLLT